MLPLQANTSAEMRTTSSHTSLLHGLYTSLQKTIRTGNVIIDGASLDVPTVVAVSWYAHCTPAR